MKRLSLLLAVALLAVAACGSDGGGAGGSATAADVRVTFSPEPLRVGPVSWTVTITNDTSKPLRLSFSTGQRADVTLTRAGEAVYQWSRGMLFTQLVGSLTVPAGGNKAFVLDEPGLEIDPGEYELTAMITAADRSELRTTRRVTVAGR
jgi:hypothetical protein